jgi:ABC-2 type transport system permease protein
MSAYANHFAYEFKTGLRNSSQLLMYYLFPLGFYAMMGLVMTQINPLFKDLMVPAMVAFVAMTGSILGLPGPAVAAREAGVYRSFKINGVPALSILMIPALTSVFHALIVALIITLTGPSFFHGLAPVNPISFALVTLAMAFACSGLGALIGVVATSPQGTVLYSQLIFLPSMLLGGIMVPIDLLPASIRPVSSLLPSTHAMQAYLGLAYGQQTLLNPWLSLLILAAGGVVAFGVAIYLFNWDSRSSARRGHPAMALVALIPFVAGMFLTR